MLSLTKIFHFEMAHAIHGYQGACKNIHGHSYELHVTVTAGEENRQYIPSPGFILDFKELKQVVSKTILETLDHKLVLSHSYLNDHTAVLPQENLVTWKVEPTAENLLIYIVQILYKELPKEVKLVKLKLYETKDSYAQWVNDLPFNQY
ncbi:MAG: 6-carboxytetrahydropterin synthase [Ferruginibacter sp.]|nr:6-carboxytetrahydropterin synthase [Ferruginibacter sp.]